MRVLLMLVLSCLTTLAKSWKMHNIYWNTTNPMFRIDNTDNVIDINVDNLAWEYDQANIICPRYRRSTSITDIETYVIYNVSKEEYEDCRITQPQPRVIAVCDSPHDLKYVTITFRSFSPTPGGLEFKSGQTYYFISTSSPSDLNRRLGGRCASHNMRLVFKIFNQNASTEIKNNHQVNVPRKNKNEDYDNKLSDFHSYLYPMRDIIQLDSNSVEQKKPSENYANEVVKQSASVMHSNSRGLALTSRLLLSALITWWWAVLR